MRKFDSLSEKEILALAISLEEEDERVYADYAEGLREAFPASAAVFDGMRAEESGHRRRLIELYQKRFGEHIPLIRRENVKGFLQRRSVWLVRPLRVKVARKQAELMELEAQRFYHKAASRTSDVSTRELLNQLADEERKHTRTAANWKKSILPPPRKRRKKSRTASCFCCRLCSRAWRG